MKFYEETSMASARETLEARVLLWPDVEPTFLLDCPSYLVGGHPFAVLVDGSVLVPALPAEILAQAPESLNAKPMRQQDLALDGWLRLSARHPERMLAALPFVRAAYEAVRAAALESQPG